jgi:hypothetical protein
MTTNHRKNQHNPALKNAGEHRALTGYRKDLKTHAGEHAAFSLAAVPVGELLKLLGGDSELDAADELLRRGIGTTIRLVVSR